MPSILYTKMHGTQNTMTMINNMSGEIQLSHDQVAQICAEVDTDGLILMEPSNTADCYMRYYNRDGSFGEMCGNGIRCLAAFYQQHIEDKPEINIDSPVGIKQIQVKSNLYTVNMGLPQDLGQTEIEGMTLYKASMGNPHAVAFMDDIQSFDLETIGPRIETHPEFPNKTNFEIVEVISNKELNMRVWERGSGITQACGTGACAVFFVSKNLGYIDQKTQVNLPGGPLWIDQNPKGEILMTGPAEVIHSGTINL